MMELGILLLSGLFALYLILFFWKLVRIEHEVRKGNKDQQEIKTRLHWLRENIAKIKENK